MVKAIALKLALTLHPMGIGGWLETKSAISEYFSLPLTATDERILGHSRGDCRGQQIWEFLAVLISLRQWVTDSRRLHLRLIGDNVGALTLAFKLRPKCRYMAVLAREVTLVIADMPFPPTTMHTPGIAHVLADKLSRLHDGKNLDVLKHPALIAAKCVSRQIGNLIGTKRQHIFVADLICKMNNGLNWVATLFILGAVGHPPPLSKLARTVLYYTPYYSLNSTGTVPTCDTHTGSPSPSFTTRATGWTHHRRPSSVNI